MPGEQSIALCKKCDAEIIWIIYKGKPHPVNARPLKSFVSPTGTWQIMDAFISHFATCPFADDFRTKKKQ